MVSKSLGNPYDGDTDLRHGAACTCTSCASGGKHRHESTELADADAPSSDDLMARAIESAVVRSIFGHNEFTRRSFAKMLGGSTLAAAIASVFPMDAAKALIRAASSWSLSGLTL